jgi:patatin-like phospholipase/acyl hydrolase
MSEVESLPHRANRFQILSLDGGGYRGIFSAAVLAAIEEDFGLNVVELFDLIVGTSTGGIIALGLGAGMRPKQIVDFYAEWGPKIFHRGFPLRRAWKSKYSNMTLRQALTAVLGDKQMQDSIVPLVVPSYDLTRDEVYMFKTPHHPRLRRDRRAPMVEVAMATSAAPTYFPGASIDSVRLIDGGVFANNPAAVGIAEAYSMFGVKLESVRLFSLGTTQDVVRRMAGLDTGGLIQWASSGIEVVLRGQSLAAHGMAQHLLAKDRYLRVNPHVPNEMLAMDRVETAELMGQARSVSRQITHDFDQIFSGHKAEPLTSPTITKGVAS